VKGNVRRVTHALLVACAMGATLPAHAMLPVIDIPNLVVNSISKLMLMKISHQLEDRGDGTVNYNTWWTQEYTHNVLELDIQNTNIDNTWVWIINNNGTGEEIIPIPKEIKAKVDALWAAQSADQYSSHYRTFEEYQSTALGAKNYADQTMREGARARRSANAALVQVVASQEAEIEQEASAMAKIAEKAKNAEGRNAQLQVANALAASEVNQFMKMRSLMMVAEVQRAAEAQTRADKDARAMAVGQRMRGGLPDALTRVKRSAPAY